VKRLAILALALLMAGCATEEFVWYKPGASDTELQQAAYECERDTRMAAASFGGGWVGAGEAQAFAERCMNAKGFYATRASALYKEPPVVSGPMTGAKGEIYAPDAKVTCYFESNGAKTTFTAAICARGGGKILGPASS